VDKVVRKTLPASSAMLDGRIKIKYLEVLKSEVRSRQPELNIIVCVILVVDCCTGRGALHEIGTI
jgi:hypothetical protein